MSEGAIRLFLGVSASMATVRALEVAVEEMRERARALGAKVRWVDPVAYHVTLKFLGWTRPETLPLLRDRVEEAVAEHTRFEFLVRGTGAFPRAEKASVLWAGIDDPDGRLAALAVATENALVPLGFAAEQRAFHPHLTVGRVKEPADVRALLALAADTEFERTLADRVVLFESRIQSSGAEYHARSEWLLREA